MGRGILSRKNNRGQGMVEYALILGLIAIAVIASMTTMGQSIYNMFAGDGAIIDTVTENIKNK